MKPSTGDYGVIDFHRTRDTSPDSAWMGELTVVVYKRVTDANGWLGFVASSTTRDLFSHIGLDSVFRLFDSREDAIAGAKRWKPSK